MKKLIILLIVVFAGYLANAQNISVDKKYINGYTAKSKSEALANQKIKGAEHACRGVDILRLEKITQKTVSPNGSKSTTAVTTFPWTEGFEGATFPPQDWTMIDNDGDGQNWFNYVAEGSAHTGTKSAGSASWSNNVVLTPDNYLITPSIEIPTGAVMELKYWVAAQDPSALGDHYEVMISTTGATVNDFTSVFEETLNFSTWTERTISLSDYDGETIYIAFVHNECTDFFYMKIDDVSISQVANIDAQVLSINEPVSGVNLTNAEIVKATIRNNGASDITGFSLKLEVNDTEIATETYTGSIAPGAQAEYTFTATADLSADGDHTIEVTVNLTGDEVAANDVLSVTITNIVCSAITTFPWTEEFEAEELSECWLNIDNDGDEDFWIPAILDETNGIAASFSAIEYMGFVIPLTPDNYLITPQIDLDDEYALSFEVGAASSIRFAEKYSVLVSTTGTDLTDFTEIHTETLTSPELKTVVLPLNAYSGQSIYIAFRHWDCTGQYAIILDNVSIYDISGLVDAQVVAITAPVSGSNLGNETVKAMIKNNGGTDITGFSLKLEVNGTEVVTDTYTGTIASLAQAEHTFSVPANMTAYGEYVVKVTVTLANDSEPTNDMVSKNVWNTPPAAITWDFEQGMPNNFTLRRLDNGVANSTTLFPNNEAWAIFSGDAQVSPIGTKCAISQSWFSSGTGAANRWMITPPVELGANVMLQWDAKAYEAAYPDGYTIKLSTTDKNTESFTVTLFTIAAENADWTNRVIDLSDYISETVYIAFVQNTNDMNMILMDEIKILGTAQIVAEPVELVSTTPVNNATNVSINAPVSATFNQNITAGNLSLVTITPTVTGVSASISGDVLTIAHGDFAYETEYTVTIPAGTISGYTQATTWKFTTVAAPIIPEVLSYSPENNAENVLIDATVSVTFDVNITTQNLDQITISPAVTGVSASSTGAVLTIAHDNFANGVEYTVTIPAGVVTNYTDAITWKFKTESVSAPIHSMNDITIYPNPSNGLVNIAVSENSVVKVLDLTGKVIDIYNVNANSTLNINQSAGMYFIHVESNGETSTHKLIIK